MSELNYTVTADNTGFVETMNDTKNHMRQTTREIEKSGMTIDEFTSSMQKLLGSFDKMTAAVDKNTQAQEQVAQAGKKAADEEKRGADKATEAIQGTTAATKELGEEFEQTSGVMSQGLDKLTKYAAGFLTLQAGKEFIQKVTSIRGEFQKLEVAFTTMLGSEQRAQELMQQLTRTAAITPFDLKGVADGAKQLLAYGVAAENVNDTLIHLGDIAAGLSIPLNDLVMLYGTTMTQGRMFTQDLRQFMGRGIPLADELAKQFGVTKDKVGELVTAGKVGAEEFNKAIMSMSSEGGKFAGLMEAQSQTIAGQISNIEDAIDVMFNEIGQANEGVINDVLGSVSTLVENYKKVGAVLMDAVVAIGLYKTALITAHAIEKASIAIKQALAVQEALLTMEAKKLAAARGISVAAARAELGSVNVLTVAKMRLIAATKALTAAMAANPYTAVAVAIAAVAFGVYKLATAESVETAARRRANEEMQTFADKLEEQQNKIKSYIQTLQDETATEYQKAVAWEMLNKMAPTLTEKYDKATIATLDLAEATKELNEQADKANYEHIRSEVQKWKETIDRIKQNMLDDARYTGGKNAIFNLMQLEDAETQLDQYLRKLVEIERIRKKIAEDNKPLEIRIQEANDNIKTKEAVYSFYKRAADLAGELKNAHDIAAGVIANSSIPTDYQAIADDTRKKYDELIAELEADVEDLRTKIAESPASLELEKELKGKEQALNDLLQMKRQWDWSGATTIPLTFVTNFSQVEKDLQDARNGRGINTQGMRFDGPTGRMVPDEATAPETHTAAQWRKDAYNNWKSAQAAVDSFWQKKETMDKATFDKEYKKLKDAADQAKKDYDKLKSSNDSEAKKNIERKKQQQAYLDLVEKQRIERERILKDSEFSITQASIDALNDGSQKTLAQITLNFQKQREEIIRGYEDLKQKKIDAAKQLWEANPNNKGTVFDASKVDVTYTEAETKEYEAQLAAIKKEYVRLIDEMSKAEIQNMYDYLSQYGSMQSQKLAIASNYAEKIAKEEDAWRKKALEKEKQSAIDNITAENLMKQIDLGALFSDYGKVLAAPLEQTIKELEQYTKSSSFKSRSIEDQKSIYEAIDNAKKQLGEFSNVSFKKIGENLYEYNNAIMAFNASSAELKTAAQEVIDSENDLAEARKRAAEITEDVENDENVKIARANAEAARGRYSSAESAYFNAQSRMVDAQQKASNSLTALNNSIESVGNIASAVASGSMKQLWDALGKKTQERIGQFIAGTRSYDNAIKGMTSTLGEQGNGMDFLVDKIKSMTTDILNSGEEISGTDFAEKITGLFSEIFGNDNNDINKFGKDLSNILSSVFNKAQEEGADTMQTVQKVGEEAVKAISKTGGSLWVMIVGLILDLLDVLKEGIGSLVQAILDSVGNAIEGILTEIGNGKFFKRIATGVGNIIGGIVKGIGNLFTGGWAFGNGNEDKMEDRINELAIANEALATSIDALTKQIGKSDSSNDMSIDAYQKAIQAERDWEKNQRDAINSKASEWTNSGYGFLELGGKSSFNYHMAGNDWAGWKAFSDALKEHGYNKDVNRDNIWTLTPEEMQILRDYRPSEWAALFNGDGHKNPQDLVNEYIERAGMQKSLTDALNEKLTGYSWEGFLDSYKNLLKNLDSTTEDFAEHINELITNALIESFVNSAAIQNRIRALYEMIARYAGIDSEGGTELTENEIKDIRKENDDISNTLYNWREAAKKAGLIVDSDEDESKAKEYFTNLRDMWLSTLMDMNADAEEWSKEITRVMVEDLINSLVLGDDFDKWLEDWKKRYTTAMESGDENAIKLLRTELENMRKSLAAKSKEIMDDMGYTDMIAEKLESVFDDLHSNFLETLMDMNADAEEWSKKITETMVRQLIERNLLNEAFDTKLDDWRLRFENVLSDNTLSDTEREARLAALRAELEYMRESLSAEAQKYLDSLGYSDMIADKEESPFKDLRKSFLSTLTDMEGDAEGFRKDLQKILTQSLIEKFVFNDDFDKYLEEWNERYMAILNDGNKSQEEIEAALDAMIEELVQKREMTLEQAEKLRERLKEEDTTFKDMKENWTSALLDMEMTAESFAESVRQIMAEKIINQFLLGSSFQRFLDRYQDTVNTIMDGEGTMDEKIAALLPMVDEWVAKYEELAPLAERIREAFGIVPNEFASAFGDLRNTFVSALMDMESDADSFAQNISKIMSQAFIDKFVLGEQFDRQMKEWQERYASIVNGEMSEEERARQLKQLADAIAAAKEGYTEQAKAIQDLFGLTVYEDQEATMNTSEKATYDQFETFLGIAVAQQMATLQGNEVRLQILATLQAMSGITTPGSDTVKEIRTMLNTTNEYLLAIKKAAEGMYKDFGLKLDTLNSKITELI